MTELLKDNLLEYYKFNLQNESEKFFTLPTLKKLSRQILTALDYIHSLDIIHCDIKPENIMVKSYSQPTFKIIDLGSSCFKHDHLSSYVQSRAYRAPEVLLESRYDSKIDVWSFGLVICELFLGKAEECNSLDGSLYEMLTERVFGKRIYNDVLFVYYLTFLWEYFEL